MPNRRKTKTGAAPLQKCDAGRVRARQLLEADDYVYKDAQQALMSEFECSRRTAQEWIRFAKKQATEDPATIRQRALQLLSAEGYVYSAAIQLLATEFSLSAGRARDELAAAKLARATDGSDLDLAYLGTARATQIADWIERRQLDRETADQYRESDPEISRHFGKLAQRYDEFVARATGVWNTDPAEGLTHRDTRAKIVHGVVSQIQHFSKWELVALQDAVARQLVYLEIAREGAKQRDTTLADEVL